MKKSNARRIKWILIIGVLAIFAIYLLYDSFMEGYREGKANKTRMQVNSSGVRK